MTTGTLHPLAADYLEDLRRAARRLPRSRRNELVAQIEEHLSEAIEPEASAAEALTVLDRVGEPEEIVAAEQPRPTAVGPTPGTQESAAVLLLLLGGFIAGFGWVVGLIFLWGSRVWTTRDKWIGTLVIPGGLCGSFFLFFFVLPPVIGHRKCVESTPGNFDCAAGPSVGSQILKIAILVILVLAPIATTAYLVRRARLSAHRTEGV